MDAARHDVEVRQLRYFVAVAEELHFNRAAARLQLSQPSLSRQIRDLERQLGADLFVRTSRSVRLTAAGQVFLGEARRALLQTEHAVETARLVGRGMAGRLAIGFFGSAAVELIPRIVRTHRATYPAVHLTLHDALANEQLARLRSGDLDVGFLRVGQHRGACEGVHVEPLLEEALCVVLPVGHPLSHAPEIDLTHLVREDFILWPREQNTHDSDDILAACHQAGFSPNVVQEAASATTIMGLVAAGVGISLLVQSYAQLRWPDVTFVPVRGLRSVLRMAWRVEAPSPAVRPFLAIAREIAALPARG